MWLDDPEALAAVAERTFCDAFSHDNDPADMEASCATAFTVDIQRAQIEDPAIDTLLMQDESGRLIGYAQRARST